MAISQEFLDFVSEALETFGPVDTRRMFGGAGLFRDGLMFALIADEQVYFKTDDENRPDFEAEDCPPFIYETKDGRRTVMSYSLAPERLYDDPEEMAQWARKAFEAAVRADAGKKKSKRKT
ncbi:MAG: TfoX/Sxy family protein [Pseudomonadota bacterium]